MTEPVHDSELSQGRLIMAEYQTIKDEQRQRIGVRDNLMYATLAAMAAVGAVSLRGAGSVGVLLALPPVCLVLGWTYLINDQKVSAIGRYIRVELTPRVVALTPEGAPPFGWETAHRREKRRLSRKLTQLGVELTLYCGTAVAAIVLYWTVGPTSAALLVVSLFELLAIVGLAVQFVLHVDLHRPGTP